MKIGILSDTHSFLHPELFTFFAPCDEIWHCGDIGRKETFIQLQNFKPLRAVHGNIDGAEIRSQCKENEIFYLNETKVLMTHIGGYPNKYNPRALRLIHIHQPSIFVCGHSHILRIKYDQTHHLLYINPGAAGREGFHSYITFLRFDFIQHMPENLEVFETERRISES
ncbi:MAG: metallophosphoesterase family protein [Bacteroidales bacterium]|jgi:putative phosphoesterase|nr:metallophosphoesterase family protein [Bacteroidales bacterium]MDD2687510.1 metallophosphoesterase family protein [Bacteroidales bacterium]MDD3329775.1 metallophosphoesterase family protein [Bacteroidales bacterium]MDD3690614.1 metallophosphoesterase family protein [Bacteroidales bacterium]MDD4044020.1 metallophosphoesterase family protein [Bacteroidales bacterium]